MLPPTVIHPISRKTWQWVKAQKSLSRLQPKLRFSYAWNAWWFDHNFEMQRRLHPPGVVQPPLFVLGLWRSGTTFVHDLLAQAPFLTVPKTWQCMNPSVFLLAGPPSNIKTVRRPMDRMFVDTYSPQEDEFALLAMGVNSAYRAFLVPSTILDLQDTLNPEYWLMESQWIEPWKDFLAWVGSERPGSRLTLKSPNHTFRLKAISDSFPEANYLWMCRNPEEMLASNFKMWTTMMQRHGMTEIDCALVEQFLQKAISSAADTLIWATKQFSKKQMVVLDFEQLTKQPLYSMEQLIERLTLGSWEQCRETMAQQAVRASSLKPDTYKTLDISRATLDALDKLRVAQNFAINSHGIPASELSSPRYDIER